MAGSEQEIGNGPVSGTGETGQQEVGKSPEGETSETGQQELSPNVRFAQWGEEESPKPVSKKPPLVPVLMLVVFGVLAAALVAGFIAKQQKPAAAAFQDLGAGISNAAGLKGNLQVRWQGKAQYQLKIEPMYPLQSAGFAYVATDPPLPIAINIRILDATGFALCGKEVVLHFDGANESGKDVFQNSLGDDGKVNALTAQGVLPCSPDQFKQFSYWDFSTNFPGLDEQNALMHQSTAERERLSAADRAAMLRKQKIQASSFTAEGDDRVSGYDSARGVLEARLGRDFLVTRTSDRAVASAWATSGSLFHYKCDQRSRCTLTHAGGGETIYVTALQ